MKMTKIAVACGLAMLSTVVAAEVSLSGNVALTTDYVFRGVSQTDNDPAIQGGFDASLDNGLYAGVWASNVDAATYATATMELDAYFGWSGDFDGVSVDVGYLRYMYPSTTNKANNTDEFHIGLGYDFGAASVSGTYNYSPDFFGFQDANYWAFGLDIPVNDTVSVSATYGITDYDNDTLGDDYNDWSLGVTASVQGFDLGLTYTDTSGVAGGCSAPASTCDGRVVFSVGKSF